MRGMAVYFVDEPYELMLARLRLFQGIWAISIPMPQVSVIPAKNEARAYEGGEGNPRWIDKIPKHRTGEDQRARCNPNLAFEGHHLATPIERKSRRLPGLQAAFQDE